MTIVFTRKSDIYDSEKVLYILLVCFAYKNYVPTLWIALVLICVSDFKVLHYRYTVC